MRVGIVGAGQLGQMLGFAARALDVTCIFVDPADEPPAAQSGEVIKAAFDDAEALDALATRCDVVTYEFENIPVEALSRIAGKVAIYPPLQALRRAQDRLEEKTLFEALDIPLPQYHAVDTRDDLRDAAEMLGTPMVVKTRRLGYDGKGQFVVRDEAGLAAAWDALGGTPLVAEAWVPFDREVSCIGVRNADGEVEIYPLAHNVHVDGILRSSCSPVEDSALAETAGSYVRRMLEHLDYVGVLALELFVTGTGLLANEFAPRVHNSGHWSIEGSAVSQFENHLRAVLNRPLGSTESTGHSGMWNLIGDIPDAIRTQTVGYTHEYGKSPRPGRKLGHVTVLGDSPEQRDSLLRLIRKL